MLPLLWWQQSIVHEFGKLLVKRDLDTGMDMLELVLLNGKNEDVNKYIRRALPELRRALSYMSDAEFEMFTSPPEMFEG